MIPKLAVSAIIVNNGKVLLARRNKNPEKEKWGLVGGLGGFRDYSDPEEVVKAEVKFDLNTEFIIEKFLDYSFYTGREGPVVTLHFIGKIKGDIKLNTSQASEYKFFSKQEFLKIDKKDIAFNHKEVLDKYFKGKVID